MLIRAFGLGPAVAQWAMAGKQAEFILPVRRSPWRSRKLVEGPDPVMVSVCAANVSNPWMSFVFTLRYAALRATLRASGKRHSQVSARCLLNYSHRIWYYIFTYIYHQRRLYEEITSIYSYYIVRIVNRIQNICWLHKRWLPKWAKVQPDLGWQKLRISLPIMARINQALLPVIVQSCQYVCISIVRGQIICWLVFSISQPLVGPWV